MLGVVVEEKVCSKLRPAYPCSGLVLGASATGSHVIVEA